VYSQRLDSGAWFLCEKVYDRDVHGVCLDHFSAIVFLDNSFFVFRHI
jgi:hypothetical protein